MLAKKLNPVEKVGEYIFGDVQFLLKFQNFGLYLFSLLTMTTLLKLLLRHTANRDNMTEPLNLRKMQLNRNQFFDRYK